MVDSIFFNNSNNKFFFFNSNYFFKKFFFKSITSVRYGCFYNFFIFYFLFNFFFGFFPFSYKISLNNSSILGDLGGDHFKIIFYYNAFVNNFFLNLFRHNFPFIFLNSFKVENYLESFPLACNLRLNRKVFYINFFNMWDIFYANGFSNIKNYFPVENVIFSFYLTLDVGSSFIFNNFIKGVETS